MKLKNYLNLLSKKDWFKKNKAHFIYISLFIILAFVFVSINSYIQINKMCGSGDILSFQRPSKEFSKIAIKDFHQFPHWNPYYFGGAPHWANAQYIVFAFPILLALLMPTISLASNLTILFNMLFAGIFIYLLAVSLNLKPRYGLLASIIYVFNGFSMFMMRACGGDRWDVYVWLPFIMFFLRKAFKFKDNSSNVVHAIIAGIGLGAAFHAGDPSFFLPILLYALFFAGFNLLFKIKKGFKKTLFITIIIFIIMGGLIAIKALPLLEYSKVSNKAGGGFSYEESKGNYLEINSIKDLLKIPKVFISPHSRDPHFRKDVQHKDSWIPYPINIGFIAFILLLLSLFRINNKNVMFYWIMAAILFLIGTGSPVYYLFWKYFPGFSMQHHVARLLIYMALPSAILTAFGASWLFQQVNKRIPKRKRVYAHMIFLILVIIILLELGFFMKIENSEKPYKNIVEELKSNELWQELSRKEGIFRIHNFNTQSIGGFSTANAVFNKVQILYGYNNVWIPEYFNTHLGVSHSAPEKFYGMLNTKYIYSNIPLNRTNLKFINKFNECKTCTEDENVDRGIDGPYLYKNELFLPRAYVVDNAILVVGEEQVAKSLMYGLMLDENFNPENTVIILSKQSLISNYDIGFLKKFNAIFLTKGSIDQKSRTILNEYVNEGGIILPNVIEEKYSITEEDFRELLSSLDGLLEEINISYFSPNRIKLDTNQKRGFMVLSEKFFMFEGWKSRSEKKDKEIFRANGMSSAIYLDGNEKNIEFYYSAKSFKRGATISLITLILITAYLIYFSIKAIRKHKNRKSHTL